MLNNDTLAGILAFLRTAERLKNVHRSAWTSEGKQESVAEHTWRLCLMATVLADQLGDLDVARLLRMCVIHDLGEALGGDIPAIAQDPLAPKSDAERRDLLTLVEPLPEAQRTQIVALWDEYEAARSPEARVAKALDKLETILQHNQGANPAGFDYAFNLGYGTRYTADHPVIAQIRALLDRETAERARGTTHGTIVTPRLELVPATIGLLLAELDGRDAFTALLDADLPRTWPPDLYDEAATAYTIARLKEAPHQVGWWMYYVLHRPSPAARRILIGTCGYKGPPDAAGAVEFGYGIVAEYQRRGFATEAARALIGHAFANPAVQLVTAQTLTGHTASIGVMEKCGMHFAGAGSEPGVVCYALRRPS